MLFKACENGEHEFETRYDDVPPDYEFLKHLVALAAKHKDHDLLTKQLEMFRGKKYVCDVCVRCGMQISRPTTCPVV